MSLSRLFPVGPLLVVLPSCGASLRAGPKFSVTDGEPALQAETTLAVGSADAGDKELGQLVFPVGFAAGSTLGDGTTLLHLESGTEWATVPRESPFGYRVGARLGGVISGPGGFFLGLRGGPTLSLESSQHGAEWIRTLSIEALANITTGGALAGEPTFGGAFTFGWDYYGVFNLPHGRPLRAEDDSFVVASPRIGRAWRRSVALGALEDLSLHERSQLGNAWLVDAGMEHASIASFSELALDLLALGAPSQLVERAHRAALDEIRHARTCYSLASAYLGCDLAPGGLPIAARGGRAASLSTLAAASLVDGAFGEGVAASVARARSRRARCQAVKRALTSIARDEARHAELGWHVVEWCVDTGGPSVLEQVEETWVELTRTHRAGSRGSPPNRASDAMRAHGWPDPKLLSAAVARTQAGIERRFLHGRRAKARTGRFAAKLSRAA